MKSEYIGLVSMLLAAICYGQEFQQDKAGTAILAEQLEGLGVKYVDFIRMLPPKDLSQVPEYLRESVSNGLCALSFRGMKGVEFNKIKSFPITQLEINNTDVTDISFVKDMPLVSLNISNTKVADLSPLRGKRLHAIDFRWTRVEDISQLAGMPIERLDLSPSQVADISSITNMPHLRTLNLSLSRVTDISVVSKTTIKQIYLPEEINRGFKALRDIPSIVEIGYGEKGLIDAKTFWRKYDAGEVINEKWNSNQ